MHVKMMEGLAGARMNKKMMNTPFMFFRLFEWFK